MSTHFPGGIPAMPYIHLDEQGAPSLIGSRCKTCQRVLLGAPRACSACGGRELDAIRLSEQGRVHTWTIVQRSFPGVRTPFVAAVVDLEGGGSIKGTVQQVLPEPAAMQGELSVRIAFRDSGQRDERGHPFVSYDFIPMPEQQP